MRRIKVDVRHDKAKLREALDAAGLQKVTVTQQGGDTFLDVPDEADAVQADRLARALRRQSLLAAVRAAKTVAEVPTYIPDVGGAINPHGRAAPPDPTQPVGT